MAKQPVRLVYNPAGADGKCTLSLNLTISASSTNLNEIYPDIARQLRAVADIVEFDEAEFD